MKEESSGEIDAATQKAAEGAKGYVGESDLVRPLLAGFGAWLVTLGPVLTPAKCGTSARLLGLLGLILLAASYFTERKGKKLATRLTLYWGFPIVSCLALATEGHVPGRPDTASGLLGAIAWGFFAYAGASASFALSAEPAPHTGKRAVPWDLALLGVLSIAALSFQAIGWNYAGAERALLVRVLALGCGVVVVGAATHYLLHRGTPREAASSRTRGRAAMNVLLVLLLVSVLATSLVLLR